MTDTATAPSGPLMCDIEGRWPTSQERAWLRDDASVAGIILFTRNLENAAQMRALCDELRRCRPGLLIAIDQEGGRVQRLREGVTRLPPMAALGRLFERAPAQALVLARDSGWLLAMEMAACGADFSFAPVLDLDDARCPAIGNRAFASQPQQVVALAGAFIAGLDEAGMAAIGKHFPGHGGVTLDSHRVLPQDERSLAALEAHDLIPFRYLAPRLAGVMPAHVRFTAVDEHPAGFSSRWLDYLRHDIGFDGAILSDDLDMEGAAIAGGPAERVAAALEAGCDMALLCNNPEDAARARHALRDHEIDLKRKNRIERLGFRGRAVDMATLECLPRWCDTRARLARLSEDEQAADQG